MKYAVEVLRAKGEDLEAAIEAVRGGLGMGDAQRTLIRARYEIDEAIKAIELVEASREKAEAPTKREGKGARVESIRGPSPSGRKRGRPAKPKAPAEERTLPMAGVKPYDGPSTDDGGEDDGDPVEPSTLVQVQSPDGFLTEASAE